MNLRERIFNVSVFIIAMLTIPLWGPFYLVIKHRKEIIKALTPPKMPKYSLGTVIAYPDELRAITARDWDRWDREWSYQTGTTQGMWISESKMNAWINTYGIQEVNET